MERVQGCVDGKLDETNYSSPMPMIGLYIAAATLVCLLFMIFDIFAGFRNKKRWIPCGLFSLNSVTLTLLSIAVKLPLDLTTAMPSFHDQLSKLTGTTLVCICMSFFFPSLGANRSDSECFANMAALSILVVTIVVNICIQLHTGVIILFRTEHIIILCCMLALLVLFWFCAFDINKQKELFLDYIRRRFGKGQKISMMRSLKSCYLYGYSTTPQFILCQHSINATTCIICTICSYVLLQGVISQFMNLKKLEFCKGIISDYKWSMKVIVVTQMITILVGTLVTTFRLFAMNIDRLQFDKLRILQHDEMDPEYVIATNPLMRRSFREYCIVVVKALTHAVVALIELWVFLPFACVIGMVGGLCDICKPKKRDDEEAIKEFKDDLIHGRQIALDKWTLRKSVKDMKRWIDRSKTKTSNHFMTKLILSKTPPSQESLVNLLKNRYNTVSSVYEMSSLSLVVLVKMATVSIPLSLSGSLFSSLSEVFEIIHFVDRKISTCSSIESTMRSKLAKALWFGDSFNALLPKIKEPSQSQSQLERAIWIIRGLRKVWPRPLDAVWEELHIIAHFIIKHRVYGSIEELYGFIEQLFVDMSNEFLIQLPNALFKDIVESDSEDYEERVKFGLKALCQIEQLEGLVQWSFPVGTNITSMITDEVPTMAHQSSTNSTNVSNHLIIEPEDHSIYPMGYPPRGNNSC